MALNPAVQYATAILCSIIAAAVLSICIQASGEQTARRGILCAAVIWFGFVATSWANAYIFEVRTFQIFAIYTAYYLIALILMPPIFPPCNKKPATPLSLTA